MTYAKYSLHLAFFTIKSILQSNICGNHVKDFFSRQADQKKLLTLFGTGASPDAIQRRNTLVGEAETVFRTSL